MTTTTPPQSTMFEIRRVFTEMRAEISKVNEADAQTASFSMAKSVRELGLDQIADNLHNMLAKEAGTFKTRRCTSNLQHNPVDYLSDNFNGTITAKVREEAVLSILQFAVQTQCLD